MLVNAVMSNKNNGVIAVSPEDTVLEALQTFSHRKIGFVIVQDTGGAVLGTVSERDICQSLCAECGNGRQTPIKEVMTKRIVTCTVEDNLARVRALMTGQRTRHVLVYDGDDLVGIISIGDVVKHTLDETLREEEAMREYIEGTGYSYSI